MELFGPENTGCARWGTPLNLFWIPTPLSWAWLTCTTRPGFFFDHLSARFEYDLGLASTAF